MKIREKSTFSEEQVFNICVVMKERSRYVECAKNNQSRYGFNYLQMVNR